MKTYFFTFLLFVGLTSKTAFTQNEIKVIEAQANATVILEDELSLGKKMPDLSWAWSSQNACFVETQQKKFTGNHLLYQAEIPPRSEMIIRLIPDDESANFSLYAYSGGGGAIVPDLPACVSCEADYKWDFKYRGKTQDHTRKVELRAINNSYPVTIGVVGANGLTSGAFTLEITLKGGEIVKTEAQPEIPVLKAESRKGEALSYTGNLNEGVFVYNLDWAWSSQNACFPATQKDLFEGHHQLYVTELPRYSELTIILVPDDPKTTLNLYAYSVGQNLQLVPNLSSCVSCEASYQAQAGFDLHQRRVQLRAVNNPYQVVIGVAGAKGVTSGGYTLELGLK